MVRQVVAGAARSGELRSGEAERGLAGRRNRRHKMAMVYEWKAGSRFPVGAQIAAERLNMIREENGAITPRAVVEDASSGNSPLHKCFEWDNEKAADLFRIKQAQKMIGALIVAQVDEAPVKRETRAFVHIENGVNRYEPIQVAMASVDMRAEVLAKAQQEIKMWRARYAAYNEFATVHTAIDKAFAA